MSLERKVLRFIRRPGGEGAFNSLALEVFAWQYAKNPFYRRFAEAAGAQPGSVKRWKDVPALPAAAFKELVLTTFPRVKARRVFRTSGTTQGGRGAHFFETLELYRAALAPWFRAHVLPDRARTRFFFLTASPEEAPDSSLCFMMGEVNRLFSRPRGRFYAVKGELKTDALLADLGGEKKPVTVLATAFALKVFLDTLAARRVTLRLPSGSRLMETGGFKGRMAEISKEELYRECGKRLGIARSHCVSEYGMTELSSQAYDSTLADYARGIRRAPRKVSPPWMRTVVIDPRTGLEARSGKRGLIRHYDLANLGSVFAVETEDVGVSRGEGFEILGRAPGAPSRGCSLAYEALLAS